MANDKEQLHSSSPSAIWMALASIAAFLGLIFAAPTGEPVRPSVRFEPSDLHPKPVVLTGAGILVFTWLSVILMYFLFEHFVHLHQGTSTPAQAAEAQYVHIPPEPRLQQSPTRDLTEFNAEAAIELNSYRWIDRSKGTVSIPIERAMDLTLQRGIPPRPSSPKQFQTPQEGYPLTGFEGKVEPEPR